jgi:hypothetical protein
MSVASDSEQLQVNATSLGDELFVAVAGGQQVRRTAIWNKTTLQPKVRQLKQILAHKVPVGLLVFPS